LDTFHHIANALATLERKQFQRIKASFRWSDDLKHHIRGSIQTYAVDGSTKEGIALPVICAVGVNYTQNGRSGTDELFPYEEGSVGVLRPTASKAAVASVIAAYERNRGTWASRRPTDPESPMGFYGSSDATSRTGHVSKFGFILIMTNVCPFITTTEWAKQPARTSERLLEECRSFGHLDDLDDALGQSIDLWIGHSALKGTKWVWPAFSSFVQRRGITEWMLTANISPRSHLWFEGIFRRPEHRLFPWYGPKKSDGALGPARGNAQLESGTTVARE
jgi:hypothetical protein